MANFGTMRPKLIRQNDSDCGDAVGDGCAYQILHSTEKVNTESILIA
jgi:hypothetical protein